MAALRHVLLASVGGESETHRREQEFAVTLDVSERLQHSKAGVEKSAVTSVHSRV